MDDPRLSLLLHQLALAYDRRSWHGPNLRGALRGLLPEEAGWRPRPERHNAWEVAVHCAYWKYRVCRLLQPGGARSFGIKGSNWFRRPLAETQAAWEADLTLLEEWHGRLLAAVGTLAPARLEAPAGGGQEFSVLELISGAAAHDLYHAGQIRLLRRMYGDARGGADDDHPARGVP